MMRQGQRTDTIKLYVHLISKLKKGEAISLGNKMLSTEFKNIANRQVKLMLEIESLHHDNRAQEQVALIIDAASQMKEETKVGGVQYKNFQLLRLKAHSAALSRAIQQAKEEEISHHSKALLQKMTNLQQFRFVMQSMFRIRSLLPLIRSDPQRIRQKMNGEKELKRLLFIVAMVKATANREQAVKILKNINQNGNALDQNKRLIAFLAEMVKKEKELTQSKTEDDTFQRSINYDKSSKTVIKNSIENECRIMINADNPAETFKKIDSSLEQQIYLHAFPLTHLYFQKNPDVIEGVRYTELYKNLITSKSFIVPDYGNNASLNSMKSKTKSKRKIKKNPSAHEEYLRMSQSSALNCVQTCRKGLLFNKHNFGNLKSSIKFVRVTGQNLEYFKTSQASDSGTRWHLTEILCVTYGKTTPRQVQNQQDFPETCFSVVMKERTLDLSVESKQRIPEMHSFMRGLTYLLGQHRLRERERYEQELRKLKQSKQNKIRQLNETIRFHQGKIQNLTRGGLLWSQLLLTINSRAGLIDDGRANKTEGIRRAASKASASKTSNIT